MLAFALLACAAFSRAAPLHVLAPANGATLRGGAFAELRWAAPQLPPSAEEWEAFLSIDGGRYYAFRITPHLDIDLQRFTFVVPNVDTRAARILIRTGDEVHEMHFESRSTFAIERDPNAEPVIPARMQFGRGESARDGDPAVMAWTEGARNGSGVTQQASTTLPSPSLTSAPTSTPDGTPVITTVVRGQAYSWHLFLRTVEKAVNRRSRLIEADVLLTSCRRNV